MCRSTLPQIYLERVRVPISVVPTHDHKVDCKSAHYSFASETRAHFRGLAHDRRSIRYVRGKAATKIALTARTTQHLIVRRQPFHFTKWRYSKLSARTAKFFAQDSFFDNSTASLELVNVRIISDARQLELHLSQT